MELNKFYRGLILQDGDYYDYVIYPIETVKTNIVCWIIPILPGTARKKTLPESKIIWSEYKPTPHQIEVAVEILSKKGFIVDKNTFEGCVYKKTQKMKQKEQKTVEQIQHPLDLEQKEVEILELTPITNVKRISKNADFIYFNGTKIIFHSGAVERLCLTPGMKVSLFTSKGKNIYLKITEDGLTVLKKQNDLVVNSSSVSSFVFQFFGGKCRFSVVGNRMSNMGEVFELKKI